MALTILIPEQKETRMNICADILQNTENDPHFSENAITCDESCFFFSPSITQKLGANPCIRRVPGHQGKKKHGRANQISKQRSVFFHIRGIVHIDCVPEGQTINQVCYKEVVTTLHEWVRKKRHEM
jgi:hypothetical protein